MATFERRLSKSERRLLQGVLKRDRLAEGKVVRATVLVSILLCGALYALIYFVAKASWPVALCASLAISLPMGLWVRIKQRGRSALLYMGALERDTARVTQFRSTAVIEFEEREDEGPTFAFQTGDHEIAFVSGQDFYESARFPNSDFSIVELMGNDGGVASILIENRGKKLVPLRKLTRSEQERLVRPEHLQVIWGSIDEIEQLLPK